MTPDIFILCVVAIMATSPILLLGLGWMAFRWIAKPFDMSEDDEAYGDYPAPINRRVK